MKKIRFNKITKNEIKENRKKAWNLIAKKNMIPLSVGIIVGSALSLLINSLANDIINQSLAKAFGYESLSYLSHGTTKWERVLVYVGNAQKAIEMKGMPINGIMYGKLLSVMISFFMTTFFLFLLAFISYSIMRRFINKKDEKKETSTDKLILDELKQLNKNLTKK